jgi:hypothetical protein
MRPHQLDVPKALLHQVREPEVRLALVKQNQPFDDPVAWTEIK